MVVRASESMMPDSTSSRSSVRSMPVSSRFSATATTSCNFPRSIPIGPHSPPWTLHIRGRAGRQRDGIGIARGDAKRHTACRPRTMTTLFEYDPDIGYRFVPHLKTRVASPDGGYLVRTNGQGFRNDREFERDDAAPRILVFGDSFTAGDGVSNGNRYSDMLEPLLPGVQVHNFGLPGSGTDAQFICYRKVAEGAPCRAVVLAVLVENIRRIVSPYRPSQDAEGGVEFLPKPYFELEGDRLVRHHDPVPREAVTGRELESNESVDRGGRFPALRRLVRSVGLQGVVQELIRYQPTPEYDS